MTKVSNINGYDLKDKEATENIDTLNNNVRTINSNISSLQSQLLEIASGSPLVATSTSEMTDTTHIYVNTTDGYWYYYNGTSWVTGGVYQATEVSEDDPTIKYLLTTFDDYINNNYNEIPIDLEKNSIANDGTNSTNNKRARTKDYYNFKSNVAIFDIPNEYGCIVYEYDSEKTFLKLYGYTYGYGSFDLNVDTTHYYR